MSTLAEISFGTGVIILVALAVVAVGGYLWAKKRGSI